MHFQSDVGNSEHQSRGLELEIRLAGQSAEKAAAKWSVGVCSVHPTSAFVHTPSITKWCFRNIKLHCFAEGLGEFSKGVSIVFIDLKFACLSARLALCLLSG